MKKHRLPRKTKKRIKRFAEKSYLLMLETLFTKSERYEAKRGYNSVINPLEIAKRLSQWTQKTPYINSNSM